MIDVLQHLLLEGFEVLSRVVVASGGVDEDAAVGLAVAVAVGEKLEERLAFNLGDRVPNSHVDGADGNRALAVTSGLLVGHHAGPNLGRVEVVTALVEQALGLGLEQARAEAFADQRSLSVASIGVEAVADDWLAIADHVGDDRDQAQRHLGEIDVGVANLRLDGLGFFANIDDLHGSSCASGAVPLGKALNRYRGVRLR